MQLETWKIILEGPEENYNNNNKRWSFPEGCAAAPPSGGRKVISGFSLEPGKEDGNKLSPVSPHLLLFVPLRSDERETAKLEKGGNKTQNKSRWPDEQQITKTGLLRNLFPLRAGACIYERGPSEGAGHLNYDLSGYSRALKVPSFKGNNVPRIALIC